MAPTDLSTPASITDAHSAHSRQSCFCHVPLQLQAGQCIAQQNSSRAVQVSSCSATECAMPQQAVSAPSPASSLLCLRRSRMALLTVQLQCTATSGNTLAYGLMLQLQAADTSTRFLKQPQSCASSGAVSHMSHATAAGSKGAQAASPGQPARLLPACRCQQQTP